MTTTLQQASRNQLANVRNPYQTQAKRVLCLCSAGLLRSPTLANLLHKEYGYNTRAAGVSLEFALVPVSEALLEWADEVVCVDKPTRNSLRYLIDNDERFAAFEVKTLNVPDDFSWNDGKLRELLLRQYNLKDQI